MEIRPGRMSDVPAMSQIVRCAYSKYIERIGKPPGPMLADYALHISNKSAWVIDVADEIIGLIVLIGEIDHLLLDNIAVDPSHHGRGIGRALLDFADEEAIRRGYTELRLYTHEQMTENLVMYPALGWEQTGQYEDGGYHRVFFRKSVTPRGL